MLKALRNKKGIAGIELAVLIGLFTFCGWKFSETHQTGVLKKNGQTIWCKMQNKGAEYCDNLYQP